jgi:hypothetical protein
MTNAIKRINPESAGSLIYAPLAQMAPFAIMMILLLKPTGLYGSPLLKR